MKYYLRDYWVDDSIAECTGCPLSMTNKNIEIEELFGAKYSKNIVRISV